jgi:hypothetical protein
MGEGAVGTSACSGKGEMTHKHGCDTRERYAGNEQDDTCPGVHIRLCLFELLLPAQ